MQSRRTDCSMCFTHAKIQACNPLNTSGCKGAAGSGAARGHAARTVYSTHVRGSNAPRGQRGRAFRCQLKQAVPCPEFLWTHPSAANSAPRSARWPSCTSAPARPTYPRCSRNSLVSPSSGQAHGSWRSAAARARPRCHSPTVAIASSPSSSVRTWRRSPGPSFAGGDAAFFAEVQQRYERWDPSTPPGLRLPTADEIPADSADLHILELFEPPSFHRYEWTQTYTTTAYRDLLLTYSNHLLLDPGRRWSLLDCISHLIDTRFGGRITKRYLTELRLAHRRTGN
jgi:hypothetical protein